MGTLNNEQSLKADSKNKKLGVWGWIVLGIIAIFLWPVTLAYLTFLLFKYIYQKYLYDPNEALDKQIHVIEGIITEYKSILEEYRSDGDKDIIAYVERTVLDQENLIKQIIVLKVKFKFELMKLRRIAEYTSDYIQSLSQLTKSIVSQKLSPKDIQSNSQYIQMQESQKILNTYSS